MKQNTNAGLPQEENPIIAEMRELIRKSPGMSLSLHLHSADGTPTFCAVTGTDVTNGETLAEVVEKAGDDREKRVKAVKDECRRLGLTVTETAAAEL